MIIVLPIILPLFVALMLFFFGRSLKIQKVLHTLATFIYFAVSIILFVAVKSSGIQSLQLGGWSAPFGITLVADLLSSIMIIVSAIIAIATSTFSMLTIDDERTKFGYYPLVNILLMGINGSFLTGDIFNLYVWFEVMLISSFVLLSMGGTKAQLEGAIKYVTLNLVSSAFFLAGVGMLYGLAGTLNMADLAVKIPLVEDQGLVTIVSLLFLIAFGIKSAVFPLFFWLPASYHTPPSAVSALFAGLLTKVGVYALIRVFTLIFNHEITNQIILVIAAFTMLTGVLGAAAQNDFRKILSFHIISQIGYMIMGLGFYTPLALTGAVFYIFHHIIVKSNLFLVGGLVNEIKGSYALKSLGGIWKAYPVLGFLFLIPALSLAGIPPLSGFWAKFTLVKAGLDLEQFFIIGVSLFVGLLTLFSMTKIWNEVFWKNDPYAEPTDRFKNMPLFRKFSLVAPIVFLGIFTLIIGFSAQPFFEIASDAADQLLNTSGYINAVLGGVK